MDEIKAELRILGDKIDEKKAFVGRCRKRLMHSTSADERHDRESIRKVSKEIEVLEEHKHALFMDLKKEEETKKATYQEQVAIKAEMLKKERAAWAAEELEKISGLVPDWDGYKIKLEGPGISGILWKKTLEEVREYFCKYV